MFFRKTEDCIIVEKEIEEDQTSENNEVINEENNEENKNDISMENVENQDENTEVEDENTEVEEENTEVEDENTELSKEENTELSEENTEEDENKSTNTEEEDFYYTSRWILKHKKITKNLEHSDIELDTIIQKSESFDMFRNDKFFYLITINGVPRGYTLKKNKAYELMWEIVRDLKNQKVLTNTSRNYYFDEKENGINLVSIGKNYIFCVERICDRILCKKVNQFIEE